MDYALGICLTFLSKAIIGIANVLDGKLSRKTFSSVWSLVTINGLLIIPILPIIYGLLRPKPLTMEQFYILIVIAMIEVFYQIPYYKALREIDTSVVMSLFNIQKVFIPVLAYFIVGERLSFVQYFGFGIIIFCSLLTTVSKGSFKLNKALYYMAFVCIFLALDSVLQKYSLNQLDWKTFYFWIMALSVPFYLAIPIFQPSARKEVIDFIRSPFQRNYSPLYAQNFATWIAGGFSTLALSLLPVTIVNALGSFQAVLVNIIASKENKRLQLDKKESISFKRILLFVLIGLGAILVVI